MDGMAVVWPLAPRSRLTFGGQSQYITSVVSASSDISYMRSTDFQTEQRSCAFFSRDLKQKQRAGGQAFELLGAVSPACRKQAVGEGAGLDAAFRRARWARHRTRV